jgi:hypothetical protein
VAAVSAIGLRLVLAIVGILTLFVAVNTAFGGIATLGWQSSTSFFQVTDERAFLVRDSHIRYYGGVYVGIGALFLLGITNLRKYRGMLHVLFALIFVGGLARLTQMRLDITFGADILVSILVELVGMPILYFWLASVVASQDATERAEPLPPPAPAM